MYHPPCQRCVLHLDEGEADDQRPESFNLCQYLETQEVNPQLSSPLFNGRIPPEIRSEIFSYALTEYPSPEAPRVYHEPDIHYDHEDPVNFLMTPFQGYERNRRYGKYEDWLRFDNTLPMITSITLLMTCRRAYLETHSLPWLQKEHVLCFYRGPEPRGQLPRDRPILGFSLGYDHRVKAYFDHQLAKPSSVPGRCMRDLVRSIRILAQVFWLEDRLRFQAIVKEPWFPPIETLRITIRQADWWDWELGKPPIINPFKGRTDLAEMQADMLVEGGNPQFTPGAWGLAFEKMPNLKTLIMEFETSGDHKPAMDKIVEWAIQWKFPLSNGKVLSTEHRPVKKLNVSFPTPSIAYFHPLSFFVILEPLTRVKDSSQPREYYMNLFISVPGISAHSNYNNVVAQSLYPVRMLLFYRLYGPR